jgi:uncharacterized metal-binding protein YceD (DUF177 family)
MKINTLQIPPEGRHLEGEDPVSVLDLQDPWAQPIAPLSYSLDVGLSDGGLFATGRIGSAYQLSCVKCLEGFPYVIEIPDFACQVELGSSEQVDLTETLREDILLALPAHPHCDWNDSKTCPGASIPPVQAPEPETKKPVWDELDRLKF